VTPKLIIGVLVSGRGTNLQQILDDVEKGKLHASVLVVVSNRESAQALAKAKAHGIPTIVIDPKTYASTEEYDGAILDALKNHDVDLVVLAGYMKVVSSVLIEAYRNRMMNIHPSLLPAFPGLHAQRQALECGVKMAGCTVHFVAEEVDAGPIILQAAVPVEEHDTEESLSARILEQEHQILPKALQLYSEGRLKVVGRRVEIADA
jgi:phosphoribosylglycinamide formyltransferase-1